MVNTLTQNRKYNPVIAEQPYLQADMLIGLIIQNSPQHPKILRAADKNVAKGLYTEEQRTTLLEKTFPTFYNCVIRECQERKEVYHTLKEVVYSSLNAFLSVVIKGTSPESICDLLSGGEKAIEEIQKTRPNVQYLAESTGDDEISEEKDLVLQGYLEKSVRELEEKR